MSFQMPSSRYILPSFVERTSYGMKESNPYNKLFEERIIFLGVQIDDASANDVMAQLITLESADPDRDITVYINSPGGLGRRRPARGRDPGQASGAALLAGADPPAVG
jgi:ATP-dependent Clp protease protease subunit